MAPGPSFIDQSFFIPKPTLTEENLLDQSGKIFIVTGGYAGCGWQLTKILYQHNATIYVAGRSAEKAGRAISEIEKLLPNSKGRMVSLHLDLADLTTIKTSADEFLGKETRLDVLWNNAGVMWPPQGSKSAQGFELQMATNCLGPFLFTELLYPVLASTAKTAPPNSVRICWAGSIAIDLSTPKGSIPLDSTGAFVPEWKSSQQFNYACSKTGNYFYANEFPIHHPETASSIVNVCFNPGNLDTELQRYSDFPGKALLNKLMIYPPVFGGYTELWSGLTPQLTTADNGLYIAPWGRKSKVRKDIVESLKTKEQGGNGTARAFWEWSVRVTEQYM